MAIESGFRVGGPTAQEINEYYETYGATRARLVESKTPAPWLGNRKRGFALESTAPPQLFSIAEGGGWKTHQDDARHLPGAGARFTGLARRAAARPGPARRS